MSKDKKSEGLIAKLYSKEQVNTGRQIELDYAKAVLIFMLALVHTAIYCSTREMLDEDTGVRFFMDSIVGGPYGAPMFMFAMGVGMSYGRNTGWKDIFKRGVGLLIISFVLNIVRFGIPYSITYLITGNYELYIEDLWAFLLADDILQFAGLAMMLFGILRYFQLSNKVIFFISLGMSVVVAPFWISFDTGKVWLNVLLGYFLPTENLAEGATIIYTDFPLFNWFIFPCVGVLFGEFLKHIRDKELFYRLCALILVPISILLVWIEFYFELGMFKYGDNCFYHMHTLDVVVCAVCDLGILGVYHYIAKISSEKVQKVVKSISVNINTVYCIHWVFVTICVNCLVQNIVGTTLIDPPAFLTIGVAISIVSILLANVYHKFKKKLKSQAK